MLRRLMGARVALALLLFALLCVCAAPVEVSAQTSTTKDVVMVLPFENVSTKPEYNWVGESFSDSLSELLSVPDLIVVSSDERELAYQRIRLPLTTLPSRATAIKLAREAKATLVVLGTYNVIPAKENQPEMISGSARIIRVNEGLWVGDTMFDGNWAPRVFDFGEPLTQLQKVQGRLAYDILVARDKAFPFTLNAIIERATKIPQKAFEAYVKGIQTNEKETRENYLKNALRFYADANAGAVYPQAAFELGHLYLSQNDWKNAAEYFSRIQKYRENDWKPEDANRTQKKKEPLFTEAAFYAGLAYWRQGDLSRALASLVPLTSESESGVRLTSIYNNAGATSIQAAREEKKTDERTTLLTQAINLLSRAAQSAPEDPMVRFNYAYALFLSGKFAEAAEQLRPVITADPRDGQAYFLFAKSLERTGHAEQAAAADDQARRYLQSYGKWQTEWQKSQSVPEVPLRLSQVFNRTDYFQGVRANVVASNPEPGAGEQDLLLKARQLYQAGQDDDALLELRRVLTIEPMNAEAYLLKGRIYVRRGDQETAISALKTAIFWDAKLIDAHILLGRIFLERNDRAQAMTYARSAIQIDPNNQEAIGLQRQVETGGK
ncbi:MAG TPA: tetratricopeptide repeat protein [Pyrinomonadaceae bacterium]